MNKSFTSNIFLALFVLAIALMLLVPLPTSLLDILLALNITFSLLLLLVGLYMPNALALLAFPSILLLSTLFRLGLNVASTRLILANGEAGRVIQAFGSFLIQGEVVVGVIIFTIITIVNFIVIARGASRVSEVAARFALDALPGKQMTIDADLRAGVITAQQAEQRRENLRKESQLYGSMDGAMKFVQGDAIAGFFIIFTNIIGGMYLGIQQGMSFADAIQTYTTLTVGDGLVSQIPALLISICAGIIVTRVSSGENTTLGSDINNQLFENPTLLSIAAGIVVILAFLPGMPAVPFILSAVFLLLCAYFIQRKNKISQILFGQYSAGGHDPNLLALPNVKHGSTELITHQHERAKLILEVDSQTWQVALEKNYDLYRQKWKSLQLDWFEAYGLQLLDLHIMEVKSVATASYNLKLSGSSVLKGELKNSGHFVEVTPDLAETFGFEILGIQRHPVNGSVGIWVPTTAVQKKLAEMADIRCLSAIEFAYLEILAYLQLHPEEMLGLTDVHSLLKQMEKSHPGLISDAFAGNFMNVARLTEVIQQLAREGVALKDLRQMIESIASYCSAYRTSMVNNEDFDLHDVVSYVRKQRKRQTIFNLQSNYSGLRLCILSRQLQEVIANARQSMETNQLMISGFELDRLKSSLLNMVDPINLRGSGPVAFLVPADLRQKIQLLLRQLACQIRVISWDELDSTFDFEIVASWHISN